MVLGVKTESKAEVRREESQHHVISQTLSSCRTLTSGSNLWAVCTWLPLPHLPHHDLATYPLHHHSLRHICDTVSPLCPVNHPQLPQDSPTTLTPLAARPILLRCLLVCALIHVQRSARRRIRQTDPDAHTKDGLHSSPRPRIKMDPPAAEFHADTRESVS